MSPSRPTGWGPHARARPHTARLCRAGLVAAGLVVVGLGPASCAGTGNAEGTAVDGPGEPATARDTPGVFDADREPPPPAYTVSRGEYTGVLPDTFASSLPGLEVLSWMTADPGGRVVATFENLYEDADQRPSADSGELRRWERSGLMLRVIPLDDLPRLVAALPPVQSLNRRAWGTVPQWQPAITASERVDRMRIHDGSIDRDPGSTPRLLLRGWVEPVIGAELGARVRAELVPQFYTPPRETFEPVATLNRPADRGTVLRDLVLSVALEPGTALVVTAGLAGEDVSPGGVGPPVPRARSLGSVLFVDQPEEPRGRSGLRPGPQPAGERRVEPSRVSVLVVVPVLQTDAVAREKR